MGLCHCRMTKRVDLKDQGNHFRVINVNDDGKNVCPGIMELTDTSIILHIKRGGTVKWPYVSLVKFGYDADLFSFVCGQRCQTGEGIFAFRCQRAEELFNLLQICMENNRRSVISETSGESTVDAKPLLPYRYSVYPAFPVDSSILSSHRLEPIGELITAPASTSSECSTFDFKGAKRKSHLRLDSKVSDGGISEMSMRSSLDGEDRCGTRPSQDCKIKNKIEKGEMEKLGSIHSVELNGVLWDTGYDTDDRRETSCARRMGYENVSAFARAYVKSRGMLVSVSSSDSHSPSVMPLRFPPGYFPNQPSSPCIFEEQSSLEQNISTRNGVNYPLRTSKQLSLRRNSINRSECAPLYFNFDLRQSSQESKTLNYIQVEMESGCDSDNPETPQSADCSAQCSTSQQLEVYTELDMEKTTALSLIHRNHPKDDGTRKTRHNSKLFPD